MSEPPSAEAIVEQFKQSRVEFVAGVPDKMTARLTELIERDSSFTFIPLCKEDEGVSICSALSLADRRAVLIIQHTGFMDSINSIQAVPTDFRQPLVMIMGLLNKEPGIRPKESKRVAASGSALPASPERRDIRSFTRAMTWGSGKKSSPNCFRWRVPFLSI